MNKNRNIIKELNNTIFKHHYPMYLIHFVTERCNAKCEHCFVNFKTAEDELSLENIEKIASTSGPYLRNVGITGGEPFIREDIFEIADIWYKNSSATSLSLTTNGSMPDRIEKFCTQVSEKNIPVAVLMSYDFIGEKHSEYRGLKDLHLKVYESYKIIKSFPKNMSATFQITLTPENVDSAYETYLYMRDVLKIANINCTMVRGRCADNADDKTRVKMAQVYEQIEKQRTNDFNCYKIKGFEDFTLTERILNTKNKVQWKYVLKSFKDRRYISPCSAGGLFGVIRYNGNVTPCETIETPIANLKEYDYNFMKLWESERALLTRKNILQSKCACTFEPCWLINLLSSPKYYPELLYSFLKNTYGRKNADK